MYIYSGLLILCLQIYGGKRWTITTITATTTILGITHRATARIHSRITTQIRVTSSLTVQTIIRVISSSPYGANDYQQPYGSQPDYSNYNQNNYQQQYPNYNQYPVEDKSAKNNATASLVLGIIGLCCCAPCGIVGLILGINSKKANPENNGLATAGIILSIIALVIWAILLITQIVSGAFISSIS